MMQHKIPHKHKVLTQIFLKLLFAASIIYFIAGSLPNLNAYGVRVDEAEWLKIAWDPLAHSFVLDDGYAGTTLGFIVQPLILLLGCVPFAIRLSGVIIGLAAILAAYKLTHKLFGQYTATLATLLMATDHNFILCSRTIPWGEVILQIMLTGIWMFFLVTGITTTSQRTRHFFYTGLFAGIAIWAKLMAFGPIIGVSAGAACTWIFYSKRLKHAPSLKSFFWPMSAGLFTGVLPVIYSTLAELPNSPLLICINKALHNQGTGGWNNYAVFSNLLNRVKHLAQYLNFEGSFAQTQYLDHKAQTFFLVLTVAGLLIYLLALPEKRTIPKPAVCFILTSSIVLLFTTCFTPSDARMNQMQIMFPFLPILYAVFIWVFYRQSHHRKIFATVAGVYVAGTVLISVMLTLNAHDLIVQHKTPSNSHISLCMKEISKFLNANDMTQNVRLVAFNDLKNMAWFNESLCSYIPGISPKHPLIMPREMVAIEIIERPYTPTIYTIPHIDKELFYIIIVGKYSKKNIHISKHIPKGYSSLHIKNFEDIYFGTNIFFCWKTDKAQSMEIDTKNMTNLEKARAIKRFLTRSKLQSRYIPKSLKAIPKTERMLVDPTQEW